MAILRSILHAVRESRRTQSTRTANEEVRAFQVEQAKLRHRTVELLTRRNMVAGKAQNLRSSIRDLCRDPDGYAKRNKLRNLDRSCERNRLQRALDTTTVELTAAQLAADSARTEIKRREEELRERLEREWRRNHGAGDQAPSATEDAGLRPASTDS